MANARKQFPEITYCKDAYQVAEGTEAILVLTEWKEFATVDLERVRDLIERPLIIDGRNSLDCQAVVDQGFEYVGIGGVSGKPKSAMLNVNVDEKGFAVIDENMPLSG